MPPYLSTVKSFADVNGVDNHAINTAEFLEASRGVVGIFDLMSNPAFDIVKKDIDGNINKVNSRYNEAPGKSKTLQELVRGEAAEKGTKATQGLLWLCRGLRFVCLALQETHAKEHIELAEAFRSSYKTTLEQFHSWFVKPIFLSAMMAVPYRETFFLKLREDPDKIKTLSNEELSAVLAPWLESLRAITDQVLKFLSDGKYDKGL